VDGFVLTGFARADAARLRQHGYTELPLDGATLLPATVEAAEATALRSLLGARAALSMATARRSATLSVHAAWSHEFETDRSVGFSRMITDPLGGAPSLVTGVAQATRIDENSIRAGASVEAPVTDGARIYVGYNALFASGHDSQSAEAGLRVTW
jgi:outer membrane autotransporter protein